MTFPQCPACQAGTLLPISRLEETYSFWVCSSPGCLYVISGNASSVKFYKGEALVEEKAKGEKRWREFEF
jgi:hypothetical protein